MSIEQEYRKIYTEEIVNKSKGIILSFSPLRDKYIYNPFAHLLEPDAVERLCELMRKNLFFYCFSEEEVVQYTKDGMFSSLEKAAQFAFSQRLPKREGKQDGLPGEALLDLLVQVYNPDAYKLAVRTIMRQNDNSEIKGYDLVYFTRDDNMISLWLGQAKLGEENYCKGSINDDLLEKYTEKYLSNQLFFIADKPIGLTEDAKAILGIINKLNIETLNADNAKRAQLLVEILQKNNIRIKIPCLLAYEKNGVYKTPDALAERLQMEINSIKNYFIKQRYRFNGFSPDILFYIFPIRSLKELRSKENGFYAGLY